eukprot:3120355-Ditylum_brightwellii.AAC.2
MPKWDIIRLKWDFSQKAWCQQYYTGCVAKGKGLDAMQHFIEEMCPVAYGRIVGVPNTKKGIDHYIIKYNNTALKENESCEL